MRELIKEILHKYLLKEANKNSVGRPSCAEIHGKILPIKSLPKLKPLKRIKAIIDKRGKRGEYKPACED